MSSHLKIPCAIMVLFAFGAFAAETSYLTNGNFQNGAKGWACTGNVAFQQDGADVVLLAGGEKKAMLIQPDLKPPLAAPLTISWEAEGDGGAARYRIYLETADNVNGAYANHDSYGTAVWRDAQPGWQPCRVDLSLPNPFDYCYLVLQIAGDSTHPVRLRNLSFRLDENAPRCSVGGYWSIPAPHKLDGDVLQLNGRNGKASFGPLPVTPGHRYRLTFTAQGFGESKTTTGYHVFCTTVSPSVEGTSVTDDVAVAAQGKSHTFTVPAASDIDHISFSIKMKSDGGARFSDFAFAEIPVDITAGWQCHLESPFYRGLFFGEQEHAEIRGYVMADGPAATIHVEFKSADATLKQISVPFTDGKANFRLEAEKLPFGRYLVDAQVLGNNGDVLRRFTRPIRVIPPAPHTVTLLPNHYPAIDGQPFFPVMHSEFPEEQLRYSRSQGVTIIDTKIGNSATQLKDKLDAFHKMGLKAFVDLEAPRNIHEVEDFKAKAQAVLTPEILSHPALYGYMHVDEPLWCGVPPEPMVAVYEFMKEFDPYHPVWTNFAPRNSVPDLKPYADTCDIIGVDIYPIPYPNSHSGIDDKTPSACGKYARRLREIGGPGKGIFIWLQGFRWPEVGSIADGPTFVYPTWTEFRFMAYDTLLNSGNGFAIWGCPYLSTNTHADKGDYFEDAMFPAISEASSLSALFCEGEQLDDLATSNGNVRCAVIRHGGNAYYFLLNQTSQAQTATVTLPSAAPMRPIGSSRQEAFRQQDRDVQLELGPYEVLIVGDSPAPKTVCPNPAWPADADPHPFRSYFKAINEHDFPDDVVCWIWDEREQVPSGKCWAFKEFDAPAGATATISVAVDDNGMLFMNGQLVTEFSGYGKPQVYDLTPFMKEGKNIVAIRGNDCGHLPCGILARIHLGETVIHTGRSWKTLPAGDEKTPPNLTGADTRKAFLVAPLGQGAWGKTAVLP